MALLCAAALAAFPAANWKVLQDTDYPHNGGGPLSPAVKGASAAECADHCQKLPDCVAVVWNAQADHGCNFKCNAKGATHKAHEEAVIVRPGVDTCGKPPPPAPPPAPPSPATLCPDSMPKDWKAPCLGGDLFYHAGPQAAKFMPTIGNGFLATFVKSGIIYSAGLFNGDSMGALGPVSHRATIPPFHVSVGAPAGAAAVTDSALDVRRAVFTQRSTLNGSVAVEERWYASLVRPSVLVHEVTLSATGSGTTRVGFSAKEPPASADLNMTKLKPMMGGPLRWTGSNIHGE